MTILRKIKTVECACGYIATFETGEFRCPDCGRIHFLWSDRTIDPKVMGLTDDDFTDDGISL